MRRRFRVTITLEYEVDSKFYGNKSVEDQLEEEQECLQNDPGLIVDLLINNDASVTTNVEFLHESDGTKEGAPISS